MASTGTSPRSSIRSASTTPSTPPERYAPTGSLVFQKQTPLSSSSDLRERWRPSYHLQPPTGWMNDPCAPAYDPMTGLYHISFQWNPNGPDWGDICWGSATSPDMIHWHLRGNPTLVTGGDYDSLGVFTGCMIPSTDGELTCAYTSVSSLPIHHTLPHKPGSESLSLAKSRDSGRTWTKVSENPILPSEPEGIEVTGWRDPFVAPWPQLCDLLEIDREGTLFGIVSGGIRDVTPTTFLYAIEVDDLTQWTYLGPLVNLGLNMWPSKWSGDLGENWEVTNFVTLVDEEDLRIERQFLIMGTEGCIAAPSELRTGSTRPARNQLWMSGSLERKTESFGAVDMSYNFGGHLDHGCFYAANSFFDPLAQRHVAWGWIPEDDLCDDLRHSQGWSGMLSMPRELRMQTLQHVVGASASKLEDITSIECEGDEIGSFTVRTLASQPLQRLVECFRRGPDVRRVGLSQQTLSRCACSASFSSAEMQTDRWELQCSFKVSRQCHSVGLSISHTEDDSQATTMTFFPRTECFTIDRPSFHSSGPAKLINSAPETAPHTLFTFKDPRSGLEESETLDIRAWRDNSVLEVFVNGRTAISTRVYAAAETFGMRFFAEECASNGDWGNMNDSSTTELMYATLFDGLSIE